MKKRLILYSFFLGVFNLSFGELKIVKSESHIEITNDEKTVLTYHKAVMPPPDGQSKIFERSGFIHPIKSPLGGVVTGIHPDDHIHHMDFGMLG